MGKGSKKGGNVKKGNKLKKNEVLQRGRAAGAVSQKSL